MRWKHTPTIGWKNKIEPGQNPTVEKQKLGMLPGKNRKTKKRDTKNGNCSTYYRQISFKSSTKFMMGFYIGEIRHSHGTTQQQQKPNTNHSHEK